MFEITRLTVKTTIRDRIFIIIASSIAIYLFIPVISAVSMRQTQEVSITLALSLNSLILLFLGIMGGVATLWKDIEKKYIYTLLSHPVSRERYLIERYLGFLIIMFLVSIINFFFAAVAVKISSTLTNPSLMIKWSNIFFAFFMTYLKYSLLISVGFLFAVLSTSFFVPFFVTILLYLAGNASQGIYDFVVLGPDSVYGDFFKLIIKLIYFILPNFSLFDLTPHASYSLEINYTSLTYTVFYFLIYTSLVLLSAVVCFKKRDLT